jgi:hypothetical protein
VQVIRTEPWVPDYLEGSRAPLRLACVTRSGWPALASLWFLPEDGRLWCATPASARVARWLAANPRCGFEVSGNEMPYRGVRGRAVARLDAARGDEMLRRLVQRYLGSEQTPFARWLLSREQPELAIALEPVSITSWDFAQRMQRAD